MEGRFHMYEGYPLQAITLPVRVFKALGADLLIVSNAVGGMNPFYRCGDVVVIDDQINLMGDNPLIGINDDRLGPRFPDMSEPYARRWLDVARDTAQRAGIPCQPGVFAAVSGPTLPTRAEYRFLRSAGADLVGMSLVPEAIAAVHVGFEVLGLVGVTQQLLAGHSTRVSIEEMIDAADLAGPRMASLLVGIVASTNDE
jgi:purine-nucleoside phosphorylase